MNFKKIFTILGLSTSILGVGFAVSYGIYQDKQPQIVKAVEYEDDIYQIDLDVNELNNYTFINLMNYFNEHYNDLNSAVLSIKYFHYEYIDDEEFVPNETDVTYNIDEYNVEEFIAFKYTNNIYDFENENTISFNLETGIFNDFYVYSVGLNSDDYEENFDYEYTLNLIVNNETQYNGVKNAIQLDIQANQHQYSYLDFLYESIGLLVGGITGISSGIGNGLSTLVNDLAISSGAMSPFMAIIFVFGGIALALGLSRWVVNLISSLGQRNR